MPSLVTLRPVRSLRLIEELAAGLTGLDALHTVQVAPEATGGATVYYPDTVSEAAVTAIVSVHDASLLSASEQRATADAGFLGDFTASLLAGAQLLGWTGDLRSGSFGANAGQWAVLTPTQQTAFMRRVLMALAVLARRSG